MMENANSKDIHLCFGIQLYSPIQPLAPPPFPVPPLCWFDALHVSVYHIREMRPSQLYTADLRLKLDAEKV